MRTITMGPAAGGATAQRSRRWVTGTVLLFCGILSPLLYAAMMLVVPLWWSGYSSAAQAVSELSAIGAPTRPLWVALAIVWALLYAAFGWGVWGSAGRNRALRVVGGGIVAAAALGLFWPPMHQREALAAGGGTLTDTLHLAWAAMNGVLTLLVMAFGAVALGARFRRFTIAAIAVVVLAGARTGAYVGRVEADLPTPWMGIWERVSIGAWLLWIAFLAIVLLRRREAVARGGREWGRLSSEDGSRLTAPD